MTQAQKQELASALAAIKRSLEGARPDTEQEIRKKWREERGLVFVREHTVPAYLRLHKPRKRRRH